MDMSGFIKHGGILTSCGNISVRRETPLRVVNHNFAVVSNILLLISLGVISGAQQCPR